MIKDAEDFILNYNDEYFAGAVYGDFAYKRDEVIKIMKDFAKAHVQAALESASVYGCLREDTFGPDDIRKCYPLENIK